MRLVVNILNATSLSHFDYRRPAITQDAIVGLAQFVQRVVNPFLHQVAPRSID